MSAVSPPFTRRKHVPSHCRRCSCFEFLDLRHTRSGEYSGAEICLGCPHMARQHVWNLVEDRKIDFSPPRNPDSPIFKKYELNEEDQNSSPMWKYSARKAQQRGPPQPRVRVLPLSPILPMSPGLLSPYKGVKEELEELEEEKEEEEGGEEIDIDISKLCSSSPLSILSPELIIPPRIGGRVTLEKMYNYMVERDNYIDRLQQRLLKRVEANGSLLKNLASNSSSAKEEMKKVKGMVDEIAGNYWSERPDKRPKKKSVSEAGIKGVNVGIKSAQKVKASPKLGPTSREQELFVRSPERASPTRIALKSGGFKVISSPVAGDGYETEETDETGEEEKGLLYEELETDEGIDESEDVEAVGDEEQEEEAENEEMKSDQEEEGEEEEEEEEEEVTETDEYEEAEEEDRKIKSNEQGLGEIDFKKQTKLINDTNREVKLGKRRRRQQIEVIEGVEVGEESPSEYEEEQEEEEEEEGERDGRETDEEDLEQQEEDEDEDPYVDPNQIYLNRYQNRPLVQLYSGTLPLMTPIKEESQYVSPRRSLSSPERRLLARQHIASNSVKVAPELSYIRMLPNELSRPPISSPLRQRHNVARHIEEEYGEEHIVDDGGDKGGDGGVYEEEFEEEASLFQDKLSPSSIHSSVFDSQPPSPSSSQTPDAQSNKRKLDDDVPMSKKAQNNRLSKRQRVRGEREDLNDDLGSRYQVKTKRYQSTERLATPRPANSRERSNDGPGPSQASYISIPLPISSSPCESLSSQPFLEEPKSRGPEDQENEGLSELSFTRKRGSSDESSKNESSKNEKEPVVLDEPPLGDTGRRKKKKNKRSKKKKRRAKISMI